MVLSFLLTIVKISLGGYWGLSAMEVMGSTKEMNRDEMIQFVLDCRHSSGGFCGNVSHDPHLLYTLSAIQVLPGQQIWCPTPFPSHNIVAAFRFLSFLMHWMQLIKKRLSTLLYLCSSQMDRLQAMNGAKSTRVSPTAL
jgi:hypothetical protein